MWDDGVEFEVVWSGKMSLLPERLTKPSPLWDNGKSKRQWNRKTEGAPQAKDPSVTKQGD